jgi:hypothetical protein
MLFIENKNDLVKRFNINQEESIMFLNCINCNFIIPNKINKIIISNCKNTYFNINTTISSLEIAKSENLTIIINAVLMTTQLDFVSNTTLHYLYENGYIISCITDNVYITTPTNKLILPYHMFFQQYVLNLTSFLIKRREECVDHDGFLLLM